MHNDELPRLARQNNPEHNEFLNKLNIDLEMEDRGWSDAYNYCADVHNGLRIYVVNFRRDEKK